MYLILFYLFAYSVKEVDLWDPIDIYDRAAETAKLIDLVHKTDIFEVRHHVVLDDDKDENERSYATDLKQVDKVTVHLLKNARKNYRNSRKGIDLIKDYSDGYADTNISDDNDADEEGKDDNQRVTEEQENFEHSVTLGDNSKEIENIKLISAHTLNPLKPIIEQALVSYNANDNQNSNTDSKRKLYKHILKRVIAPEKYNMNTQSQSNKKVNKSQAYQQNLKNHENVPEVISSEYKNGTIRLSSKDEIHIISKKDLYQKDTIAAGKLGNKSAKKDNEADRKQYFDDQKDDVLYNIDNVDNIFSQENKNDTFSKTDEWDKNRNDLNKTVKKEKHLNNEKEYRTDDHFNKKQNDDIAVYDWYKKQDMWNKKDNSNKKDDGLVKTDTWNKKDDSRNEENNSNNEKDVSNNEKNDSGNMQIYNRNEQDNSNYEVDDSWNKKAIVRNKKDERWNDRGDSRIKKTNNWNKNTDSWNKNTNSWSKNTDSWNKNTDSWNKNTDNWNKKYDSRNQKNYRNKNEQDGNTADGFNERGISTNKREERWKKKIDSWNEKDNSRNEKDDSKDEKNERWKKTINRSKKNDRWKEREDSWNQKRDELNKEDDNWNMNTDAWNNKGNGWNKQNYGLNQKTDGWNKKDISRNKKEERWSKRDRDDSPKRNDDDINVENDNLYSKKKKWDHKDEDWNKKESVWDINQGKSQKKGKYDDDRVYNEKNKQFKGGGNIKKENAWDNIRTDNTQNSEWGNYAFFKNLKFEKNSNEKGYDEPEKRKDPTPNIKFLRQSSPDSFSKREDNYFKKPENKGHSFVRTPIPFVGNRPLYDK